MANPISSWPVLPFVTVIILAALFSHLCFLVSSAQIRCLEEDRSLLLRLKHEISISQDEYTDLIFFYFPTVLPPPPKIWSWNGTENYEDCCLWEGVTCDSHSGHVVGLDLSSNFIGDGINGSSSIFRFQHLQSLSLADNIMYDSGYPSGFSNLSSLTHLNLSAANFEGPIPEREISLLGNLVSLDLSHNSDSSVDMEKLVKNLTQLRVLRMDEIDLSQTMKNIPWSTLPDIQELSLTNCNFTGEALQFSFLLHLKSLTHLILSFNDLAWNISANSFSQFPHLINLQLSGCKLAGRFPNTVFFIPNLQVVDVSDNDQLSGTLPHFPAGNSSLQLIYLGRTLFSGKIPDSMSYLVSLQELDLYDCQFHGRFPSSVFLLPKLKYIDVSVNYLFTGTLPEFPIGSNPLQIIRLSHTNFSGELPDSIHNLVSLNELELSNCMFHGVVPSSIDMLTKLQNLNLSGNNFNGPLPSLSSSQAIWIDFSSNNFSGNIPLSYASARFQVQRLYLNNNNLQGKIPPSLFSLPSLQSLRLGSNRLEGQLEEFKNSSFGVVKIDLSNNKLGGNLPLSIFNISINYLSVASNDFSGKINLMDVVTNESSLFYLDLSDNHFQVGVVGELMVSGHLRVLKLDSCNVRSFPHFLRNYNRVAYLGLSSNKIEGNISPSVCGMHDLEILDLSNNHLNGLIPPCLTSLRSLHVLSLRNNQLSRMLPRGFTPNCTLRTLDVNRNHLGDRLPETLSLCKSLEVINVGKNNLKGKFPVWLENLPLLRVLILHSNQFSGTIGSENRTGFPLLQIFDVSSNEFVGELPSGWFTSWKEMMKHSTAPKSPVISFITYSGIQLQQLADGTITEFHYQDSVTVTDKGILTKYRKILTILILIDVSNNRFTGKIPEAIARLESLHLLNLSNNHFTGRIPVSFGQLKQLESLDLSSNKLSGNIPTQLTELTFMSKLNLSQNSLTGEIPRGRQFETFGPESYEGNPGLCGLPLPKPCYKVKSPPTSTKPNDADAKGGSSAIDWEYYRVGIACGSGTGLIAGFVVAYLVFGNFFVQTRRVHRYAVRPLRTR